MWPFKKKNHEMVWESTPEDSRTAIIEKERALLKPGQLFSEDLFPGCWPVYRLTPRPDLSTAINSVMAHAGRRYTVYTASRGNGWCIHSKDGEYTVELDENLSEEELLQELADIATDAFLEGTRAYYETAMRSLYLARIKECLVR